MTPGADEMPLPAQVRGPLAGVKVVEFAQVIAGPLAGTLLADMGADVVHVEQPGVGDTARQMGPDRAGTKLWWKVLGRNKRSVTLDLRKTSTRSVVERLLRWADVVIVTFRAETLGAFGLDWPTVHAVNPRAILLQISGYGATTSKRDLPGFGKMGEARSGVVHLTGFPEGPPMHTGFSHGDATTGLMGAFAITAALYRRARMTQGGGEWIDLALPDTLLRLVEWQLVVRDQLGYAPTRAGNRLAVAPAAVINTYQSADGEWITVTSATRRSVDNVAKLLADVGQTVDADDELALDDALGKWIAQHPTGACLRELERAGVVAAKVFDAGDILADPTFQQNDTVITVGDEDLGPIRMQGVIPRLHDAPGRVWRTGPRLGADNDLVYGGWLQLSDDELSRLHADDAI